MKIPKSLTKQFLNLVENSNDIFITGHSRPDGDTIGSALALFLAIRKNFPNKKVDIVMKEPFPDCFEFLPSIKEIKVCAKIEKSYDLGIILESYEFSRTGGIIDISKLKNIVNIDHHNQTSDFGSNYEYNGIINIIFKEYSACAELIFDILRFWKIKFDKEIALCLYTGIVTDTGRFQWANTTAKTFITAAELLKYGINPFEVYKNIYSNRSKNSIQLLGKVLSTIKVLEINNYKIAYIIANHKMFVDTHTTVNDTEEFITFPGMIKNVDISIFFREEKKDVVKISFRSHKINVEKIAQNWCGGGHIYASGATIKNKLRIVVKEVLDYLKQVLK